MKKIKQLKKIWFIAIFFIIAFVTTPTIIVNAEENDMDTVNWFVIMPEVDDVGKIDWYIKEIWSWSWNVNDKYNEIASELTTSEQLASWIMTRDTIMDYLWYIIKFISQLWLVVWAAFIMYAWYKYMLSVFNWNKAPTSTLTNAIIWVTIVIFSYAIMRILTSVIWLT